MKGVTELDDLTDSDRMGVDKLRTLLVSSAKESAFRKVVQATMIRERQHGPVIELNRISGRKIKAKGEGSASGSGKDARNAAIVDFGRTVYGQMVNKMHAIGAEFLLLPHRIWKVKFVGE